MIGFIHITKAGGTDFKGKYGNDFIFDSYHYNDAKFFKKKNIPSFAIVREPIERFKSLFRYNLKGGSDFWEKDYFVEDINLFIKEIKKDPTILNNFEGGWQFRKQVDWLNDETYVVKYDKNIYKNIKIFLKNEFNIDFQYNEDQKINVSSINDEDVITDENIAFLKKYYKEDFELYDHLKDQIYLKINEDDENFENFENFNFSEYSSIEYSSFKYYEYIFIPIVIILCAFLLKRKL